VEPVTYPSGRVITYTSSAAARSLSAVDTANGINYATSALYSPPGAFSSLQNGSGIVSTFYLNNRLEPCRISVKTTGTAPTQCSDTAHLGNILDFTYDYNFSVANNGNVKQITNNLNSARTQSFTYDEMNRVKTALTQGTAGALCWGLDYSFDIYANLTTVALDPARPSCTWTTLNAGISTSNRITNTGFSYDAAGNVLSDGSFSYTWDAESQLKTAAGVTYTYDGDGRRVQKSNGKLYWYGAGGEVIAESDAAGNFTDEYVFFGGRRIARRNVSSGNVYYFFADHLGSSRVVLQSGQSTPCYDADFDPFGGEHVVTNTCPQNYKFTGKERDTETNLDNFEARYYSSQFGRFHSADWSAIPVPVPYADLGNPQTLNLYAYVKNNPLNLTDPTGHAASNAGGTISSSEGMYVIPSKLWIGSESEPLDSLFSASSVNSEDNTETSVTVTMTYADYLSNLLALTAPGAQQQAQNQTTLNLNGTNVDITFNAAEFSNGQKGAVIDANPQGACDNCRWAQTVSRTGDDAHGARTDRDPQSGPQPLYPTGIHAGNDAANLSDKPRSNNPGTFTAVSTLGVADKANKTFKVTGSMTWGYKIDKSGNVSGVAPRVATKAEQARSIAVLRRESPGWTISQ